MKREDSRLKLKNPSFKLDALAHLCPCMETANVSRDENDKSVKISNTSLIMQYSKLFTSPKSVSATWW